MAPTARYESENVSAAPLGKPLDFPFSGKTAPNRLYGFTAHYSPQATTTLISLQLEGCYDGANLLMGSQKLRCPRHTV